MHSRCAKQVLILVVMEYGLGEVKFPLVLTQLQRLNPCCNGIWSRSCCPAGQQELGFSRGVLILVVMEYGLGAVYRRSEDGLVLLS